MDSVIILAMLNLIVLVVQVLIYRYLRRNRYTADVSNQETIQAIATDMNRLSRTVSIMLEARGIRSEGGAPLENGQSGGPEGAPLSEEDAARQRLGRKADLYKRYAGRR